MKEKVEQLIKILSAYKCPQNVFVNKDLDFPEEEGGFKFVKKDINGIVMFNGPFSNMDMSLDDILSAEVDFSKWRAKSTGNVIQNAMDKGQFLYLTAGNKMPRLL